MNNAHTFPKQHFKQLSDGIQKTYDNRVLVTVNDHCLRMSVFQGIYEWHYHENTDELFVVLEGQLTIAIRNNETIILLPGEFLKIPAGTVHRTSSAMRTVNLCFEKTKDDTIFVR